MSSHRVAGFIALGCASLVLAFALASADPWSSRSDALNRRFPDLASRRSQLTPMAVVVDVAEFEVQNGYATWVYLDDCRALGQSLGDALTTALAAKGYTVKSLRLLSIGAAAAHDRTVCRVYTSYAKRDARPDTLEVSPAPFQLDSSLSSSDELRAAWQELFHGALHPKGGKKGKPSVIAATPKVRDVIGADYALVAVGLGTHNVEYRGTPMGAPGHGVVPTANPSPYPGSLIRITLVDCTNGDVLWSDARTDWRPFSAKGMDRIARDFAAQMP